MNAPRHMPRSISIHVCAAHPQGQRPGRPSLCDRTLFPEDLWQRGRRSCAVGSYSFRFCWKNSIVRLHASFAAGSSYRGVVSL